MRKIDVNSPPPLISIGQAGEKGFRSFEINWSAWRSAYPNGVLSINITRPDGQTFATAENITECPYVWHPQGIDTEVAGRGELEIMITDGEVVGKSVLFEINIGKSNTAGPAPSHSPSWYEETLNARDEAVAAVEHYPYINDDTHTWWVWDVENEEFVDTGVAAQGPQGETGATGATGPAGPTALIGTASGSVASFPDGADAPARDVTAQIVAVQSWSGTPSPDNVRPISGWSGCNVTHNGEITPISFGATVYGGTLNVTTGVLTVTHALMDISAATWAYIDTYDYPLFRAAVADAASVSAVVSVVSSKYEATTNRSYTTFRSNDFNGKVCVITDQSQPWIALQDHTLASLDAFNAASSDLQIVYELAAPQTVQLTPTEISLLLGGNTVSADCGDISIEYYSHPVEPTAVGEYVLHCTVTATGRSFKYVAQA